jgi:hypothetical protein
MTDLRQRQSFTDRLIDGQRAVGDAFAYPTNDQVFSRLPRCPRQGSLPMGGIDLTLSASLQDRMRCNDPTLIQNANLVGQLVHLDDAPGSVRDAVIVAADRYQAVMTDATFQSEEFVEGHGRKRLQLCLFGRKSFSNNTLCRAVQAHIRNRC